MKKVSKRFFKNLHYHFLISVIVFILISIVACGGGGDDGVVTDGGDTTAGTWTHPSGLSDNISPDGEAAENPQVAMDNNGNAIITWNQNDGSNDQIFKSEYRNGAWTHPSGLSDNISPDGQSAYRSQIAMDNNGNAIITWQQWDFLYRKIFMSEYY
jgi:hypothetical protein